VGPLWNCLWWEPYRGALGVVFPARDCREGFSECWLPFHDFLLRLLYVSAWTPFFFNFFKVSCFFIR
jgi:hypothetical protein